VTKPKERKLDSHNLGKTTLIHVLDFTLLRGMGGGHFLERHQARFESLVFFIEVALADGGFVTVRRSVADPNCIAFKRHRDSRQDFSSLPDESWDHTELALSAARDLMDAYLNLTSIQPWNYRKGFSYFLRTQNDYLDVFQIQKFVQGKDRDWKPYLARVFGLDHDAAREKYLVDQALEEAIRRRALKEAELPPDVADRNTLATEIEIKSDVVSEIQERLDAFDFSREERRISKELVEDVERRLSELGNQLYNIRSDIEQIESSISTGYRFDLKRIAQIFSESEVLLPDNVKRSYDDLLGFNKRLTQDRNAVLRARKKELEGLELSLQHEQEELSERRRGYLEIVRGADSFRKYKALQNTLAEKRAELAFLEAQLSKLDALRMIDDEIRALRIKRSDLVHKMDVSLRQPNARKNMVIRYFNRFAKRVLNINGEFVIAQNSEGNFTFKIYTKDALGNDTSQADGKTYSQLICALFDMAVLKSLEGEPFFHFVYHDGLLEGLDDRKKLAVLELVRELIADGKIQYILSVIESDLPRDENDQKVSFSPEEVILTLDDSGDQGRLFKMPPF
jgi:uncharacterized protein YydD (DUF2326 family)